MASVNNTHPPATPTIHLGWVVRFVISGLVITALAFGCRFVPFIGPYELAVWQSILTNFGVGLLSAAVLLLFEPKFRKAVTDTVSVATAGVKEEVREAVKADVEQKFASINDRVNYLYDQKVASGQSLTKNLTTDFTSERAMELFREASSVSALPDKGLQVQGESDPTKLLVHFQLRQRNSSRPLHRRSTELEDEVLYVSLVPTDSRLTVELPWEPGQSFTDLAFALGAELQRNGGRALGERIDWDSILERLEHAMDVALNSSMKTENAVPLDGALYEYFQGEQDWYITTAGIYCPEKAYTLSTNHFAAKRSPGRPSADYSTPPPPADAPTWVKQSEWDYVFGQTTGLVRGPFGY